MAYYIRIYTSKIIISFIAIFAFLILLSSQALANGPSVRGTITLNGQPLENVEINFIGQDNSVIQQTFTDASGEYFLAGFNFNNQNVFEGYVVPTLTGYQFSPVKSALITITQGQEMPPVVNFTAYNKVTISGQLTAGGIPLSNIVVNLSGSESKTTNTDANGNYSFEVDYNGSYTVTPSNSQCVFTPASKSFANLVVNAVQNFSATVNQYTLSGKVTLNGSPLANVAVNLSGSASGTITTTLTGTYSFKVSALGNYQITPEKDGYDFSPDGGTFNNVTANGSQDFSGSIKKYYLVGKVLDESNIPISGIIVTLSGSDSRTTTTDANGNYSFYVLALGDYQISVKKEGYSFTPASISYTKLIDNQSKNIYAKRQVLISGLILYKSRPLSGAKVTLSGTSRDSITTSADGKFNFYVGKNGTYSLSFAKEYYVFTPANSSFSNLTTDQYIEVNSTTPFYPISGMITFNGSPQSGVTVKITGDTSLTLTTNSSGSYSASLISEKNYIIAPSKNGYYFTPVSKTFTSLQASQTANFASVIDTLSISGKALSGTGSPMKDVNVKLEGSKSLSAKTDANGAYSFRVPYFGSYTVTASLTGYKVQPANYSYTSIDAPKTDQNFTVIQDSITVSGEVYASNRALIRNITLDMNGVKYALENSGPYSIKIPVIGTYTLTAKADGYIFTPASKVFTNVSTNQTQDFIGNLDSVTISGNLGTAKVATVSLLGMMEKKITVIDGNYSFRVACLGDYTVQPSDTRTEFIPPRIEIRSLIHDTVINFSSTFKQYYLTGTVKVNKAPMAGVIVRIEPSGRVEMDTTDSNGKFSFLVNPNTRYTIISQKSSYRFPMTYTTLSKDDSVEINGSSYNLSIPWPNGIKEYEGKDTMTVCWKQQGLDDVAVRIYLLDDESHISKLLSDSFAISKMYNFTLPVDEKILNKCAIRLEMRNDPTINCTSAYFKLHPVRSLTLNFPSPSGLSLQWGKPSRITWQSTGNIKNVILYIKQEGAGYNYQRLIPNTGTYDWMVDILPSNSTIGYYMKIVDQEKPSVFSENTNKFIITYSGAIQLKNPVNDYLHNTPISVLPKFQWNYISPDKRSTTYKRIFYTLQVARDSLFADTVFTKSIVMERAQSDSMVSYSSSELDVATNYYWRVTGQYDPAIGSRMAMGNSLVYTFKTESLAPSDKPVITMPANNRVYDQYDADRFAFGWNHVLRGKTYTLQISEDSTFTKNVTTSTTNGLSYLASMSFIKDRKYFWRVKASNQVGDGPWSDRYIFYTRDKSQTVCDVVITSDNWTINSNGTMRANDPDISYKDGNGVVSIKGFVTLNSNRSKIDSSQGAVYFNVVSGRNRDPIPLFSGNINIVCSFNASGVGYIAPGASCEIITDSSKFGRLTKQYLSIIKIDMINGNLYFDYNPGLYFSLPGIMVLDNKNDVAGGNVHFHTKAPLVMDKNGKITGSVNNFLIQVSSILLNFKDVTLSGSYNGTTNVNSKNYTVNYAKYLGTDMEIPESGGITISSDNYIVFDNIVASFPQFSVYGGDNAGNNASMGFGFQAPQMSFRWIKEMGVWGMDIDGSISLPFSVSLSSAGNLTGESGTCSIAGGVTLLASKPYFQSVRFAASGCWSIEVAPFIYWTGLSGHLDMYYKNEKVIGMGLGGTVEMEVSIPPTLLTGTLGVEFSTLGYLGISGKSYLFGIWPISESSLYLDARKKTSVILGGGLKFYWAAGVIVGSIEGAIEFGQDLFTSGKFPNMYLEGIVSIQIPKGIIDFGCISLPRKNIEIGSVGCQLGRFMDGDNSKGFGFQAYANILKFKYYCLKHSKKETFELNVCMFIPFEKGNSLHVGFKKYTLVKFDRAAAIRRKGNVAKFNTISDKAAITKYTLGAKTDTLLINVNDNSGEKLVFGIKSFDKNLPNITVIDPENSSIDSKSMLADMPDLLTDSGYVFPVEPVGGTYKVCVTDITPGSNYDLVILGGNAAPTVSIDNVQKLDDDNYKITYTAKDPDDAALVDLYYTKSDTSTKHIINDSPITEQDLTSDYTWNTSEVENGEYKILAVITDSKHESVKSYYQGTVVINNTKKQSAPTNLRVYRTSGVEGVNSTIVWDENSKLNYYTIAYSRDPAKLTDTIRNNRFNFCNIYLDSSSTYYFKVCGRDINNIYSDYSNVLTVNYGSLTAASTSLAAPNNIYLSSHIDDNDEASSYVAASWGPIEGATGYMLYFSDKNSTNFNCLDLGSKTEATVYNLQRGNVYRFKVRAYNDARVLSGFSKLEEIDFISSKDTDDDGIPDEWEMKYFGSLSVTNSLTDDIDGDGLTNADELRMGTNPNNVDTDNDGIWDDVDPHPLIDEDANGDGMGDDWQSYYGVVNPDDDPDKDGLTNLQEYQNRTNPLNPDTDGGGLNDGDEVKRGLNPLKANDDKWTKGFVELSSFKGRYWLNTVTKKDTVVLNWITTKENNLSGFDVYRVSDNNTYYQKLNSDIIPALADTILPHRYQFSDGNIADEVGYSYYLEGVSKFGNVDSLGIYKVSAFTGVKALDGTLPENYELSQNYPNPFNPVTNIRFTIPEETMVKLKVYDMLGREVTTLLDKVLKAGTYLEQWDAKGVSSGMYIYKLQTAKFVKSKTMMLIR